MSEFYGHYRLLECKIVKNWIEKYVESYKKNGYSHREVDRS